MMSNPPTVWLGTVPKGALPGGMSYLLADRPGPPVARLTGYRGLSSL